jgi:hypothetical protein
LASIISMLNLHVIFLSDYTKIFHLVYKGDVPSFQCKTILDRSMPAREIDGLSLVFIDFYIPALTPRLHRSEAALELSKNIALCGLYNIYVCHQQRALDEHLGFAGHRL